MTGRAPRRGHAIEIRLNAEDPEHDFRPSPGRIGRLRASARARACASTPSSSRGSLISPFYDSMVAKLIVWDADRTAAIARAERALRETVVEGVPTTRDLALEVLGSEPFRSGEYSTSTLEAMQAVSRRRLDGADQGVEVPACRLGVGNLMSISRRQARRQALFLLYQWDLSGQEIGSQYAGEIDPVGTRRRRSRGRARAGARRCASPQPRRAGRPTGSAPSSEARCASPCTSSTTA